MTEEDADVLGVRGGKKTCDFAPERRGVAPFSRCDGWKLKAPGIALGEFVILYAVASHVLRVVHRRGCWVLSW